MITITIKIDENTEHELKFSCGACIHNKRGAKCIHFDEFLQPKTTLPQREMFYLIKKQGRGSTNLSTFFVLQVAPSDKPIDIDYDRCPVCPITNEYTFRCGSKCCMKRRELYIKGYVDLELCHTFLDKQMQTNPTHHEDGTQMTSEEQQRARVLTKLTDCDPIPYAGCQQSRRALRLGHMRAYPELYVGCNLDKIMADDDLMADGTVLTELIKAETGFDAKAQLSGKKGKVQLDFNLRKVGKAEKGSKRRINRNVVKKSLSTSNPYLYQHPQTLERSPMHQFVVPPLVPQYVPQSFVQELYPVAEDQNLEMQVPELEEDNDGDNKQVEENTFDDLHASQNYSYSPGIWGTSSMPHSTLSEEVEGVLMLLDDFGVQPDTVVSEQSNDDVNDCLNLQVHNTTPEAAAWEKLGLTTFVDLQQDLDDPFGLGAIC